MIEHDYKELFSNDSIDKQLVIATDDGAINITNTELHENSFELNESISSDNSLKFGTVISSSVKFTVSNVFTGLKNKWITVTMSMNRNVSNPFKFGRYKVYSDIPTADRKKRDIVAYDALYDILQANVSKWYNSLLPKASSTTTLKTFRGSFFSHFGIEQEEISLINDDMVVTKTIQSEELSGKAVLNAICEINGCFGHIGRDGKFKYIYLTPIEEGLYPSETLYPSEKNYPGEPNTFKIKTGVYISANYEDYLVEKITKIQIYGNEDSIGGEYGDGNNAYMIRDNFLTYGKSNSELNRLSHNLLDKVGGIYYRPFAAKTKGNPCLEVGDGVRLSTKYMAIHSYILQRTLTGIQALRDEYTAEGTQYQPSEVNSTARSIQQLKGRTNTLTRTLEETRSELTNLENNTATMFRQTSEEIQAEATRAQEAEASLKIRADGIALSVSDLEDDINSEISILERKINLKVESDEVQSMIDISLDRVVIKSDQIKLEGYTNVNSVLSIDELGNLRIDNESDGSYAELAEGSLYITGSNGKGVYLSTNGILAYPNPRDSGSFEVFSLAQVIWSGDTPNYMIYGSDSVNNLNLQGKKINLIGSSVLANGSKIITASNIDNYVPDTSDFVDISDFNDLEDEVSFNTRYINILTGSLDDIGNEISDLERRISALESAL